MKLLLVFLVCTLYAQVELTRVIINWSVSGKFLFEIAFMWVFYVIGITFVVVARRRRWWIK